MYTAPGTDCCTEVPSNTNPRDEALQGVTDLIDCCDSPRTVRGDWYYPDGRRVEFDPDSIVTFRANRGSNEVRNGRHFYGSVCLFRRYGAPSERGRFRCELPSAADGPYVNQILHANIGDNYIKCMCSIATCIAYIYFPQLTLASIILLTQ